MSRPTRCTCGHGRPIASDTAGFDSIDLSLSDASISVDDTGSAATLRSRARLTATGRMRQFDATRSISVSWAKTDGTWRVTSIDVAAPTHEHPEALP